MNFIGNGDDAVLVKAELVLGVDQNQAVSFCYRPAAGEQIEAFLRRLVPLRLAQQSLSDDIFCRDRMIVRTDGALGCRRNQHAGQLVVFLQPLRQGVAINRTLTVRIHGPDAGVRGAGNIIADHHFDRQHLQPFGDDHVRVGMRDHVIGADIGGLLEPELRGRRQHMALVRNRRQHMIESRLAIRRNHHATPVGQVIAFAHLASLVAGKFLEFGVCQYMLQPPLIEFIQCHGPRV